MGKIGILERGKPWAWRYNCQRSVLKEMIIKLSITLINQGESRAIVPMKSW